MGIINRFPGGAGGVINLILVGGTTQPTSPKANTIWVNTSETLTGHVAVQATAPATVEGATPATGDIWIQTGASGNVAVIIGGIAVSVRLIWLYASGAWVRVSAQYYSDGWENIGLYLLSGGNLFPGNTGGWSFYGKSSPNVITSENGLLCDYSTSNWSGAQTVNSIDLTDYSLLRIVCTVTNIVNGGTYPMKCGAGTTAMDNSNCYLDLYAARNTISTTGSYDFSANISALNGSYKIGFGGLITATIKQILLQ